ncbi:MAG TPA: hypothetical protein VK566_05145 [Nitrososphaeraceae archaeon]|jgi:hypothetical protein|nr:hypothetical protein [Nitrososphaeraceae archaeon]
MSEDFTNKLTCLLCDTKIDAKSGIQICSTCAIIAMPDEDFQKLCYISLLENVNSKEITDNERTRIFDLYIHSTRQEDPIETY